MAKKKRRSARKPAPSQWWAIALVVLVGAVSAGLVAAALAPSTPPASASRVTGPLDFSTYVPERVASTRVMFIGDSYSAGTGASDRANRWTTLVSDELGWIETNEALGGTGYVRTAGQEGCGRDYCGTYGEVITTTEAPTPGIVVISGGRNDGRPTGDYASAIQSTIQAAQGRWPEARIALTSPIWDDDASPSWMPDMVEAARAASEATGATFVDIGQPLSGRADYLIADGIHPNDAGYAAIAEAFLAAWPT
jgi:lysophospholipase L1-like esterase